MLKLRRPNFNTVMYQPQKENNYTTKKDSNERNAGGARKNDPR